MPLTERQKQQVSIMNTYPNVLSYGGSRSGKTFGKINFIVFTALTHPGARWLIARRYATDIRGAIWQDTLPKVLDLCNLHEGKDFIRNEAAMMITFHNGSRIICGGLDDKERVDKILGQEYFGIYLNESQDIPYSTVKTLLTRLAQRVLIQMPDGKAGVAQNRLFVDLNPTGINHWTFKIFIAKINPETGDDIPFPETYASIQMNPGDNQANLPPGYIEKYLATLSGAARNRFLLGEFTSDDDLKVFNPIGEYKWAEFQEWLAINPQDTRLTGGIDLGFQDADALSIIAYRDGDPVQWLVYEHKARRNNIEQLVEAIKRSISWVSENINCRDQSVEFYCDTATLRHGKEGDAKKSIGQLQHDYGLPVRPAYKRDKRMAIEHLQSEVNTGRFRIPQGGIFFQETEITVWTRCDDGSIIREIDDEAFHPDLLDAVLYPMRFLVTYGNKALVPYEPPPSDDIQGFQDTGIIAKMRQALEGSNQSW